MEDKKKVPSRDKPRELKVTVDGFADYSKKLLNSASRIDSYLDGRGKGRKKEVEFFATFVKELYRYLGLLKNINTATSNIDKSIKDKIEKHLSSLILSNDKNYGDFISHLKRIDVNVLKTSLDDIKQAILSISFPEQVQGTAEIPQTKTTSKKTRSIEKITVSPIMPKDSRSLGISQELFDQMSMSQDDFFNRLENIFINSATVIQREMGDLRTSIVSAINIVPVDTINEEETDTEKKSNFDVSVGRIETAANNVPVDTINEEETDTEKESNFYVSIGRIETAANNVVALLKTLVYDTQEQGKIKPIVSVKPVENIEIKKSNEKFNKDLKETITSSRSDTKGQGIIGEGIELLGTSLLGPMFSLISSSLIEPFAGKDLGTIITKTAGSAFAKIGELADRVSFIDGEDFISKKPTGKTTIPPLEVTETYIPEEPVVQTFDADAKTVFISVRDLIADNITHQTEIKEYAQLSLAETVLFREDFIKYSELGFVRQDQTYKLLTGISGTGASMGLAEGLLGLKGLKIAMGVLSGSVAAAGAKFVAAKGVLGAIGAKLGTAIAAFAPGAIATAVAGAAGYAVGTLINDYLLPDKLKEQIGDALLEGSILASDLLHTVSFGLMGTEDKRNVATAPSPIKRTLGEYHQARAGTLESNMGTGISTSRRSLRGYHLQKAEEWNTKQSRMEGITQTNEPLTVIPSSPWKSHSNEAIERVESKDETMIPLLKEAIDKINNIQVNVHTTADTVYASPPVSNNSPSFDAYIKGGE